MVHFVYDGMIKLRDNLRKDFWEVHLVTYDLVKDQDEGIIKKRQSMDRKIVANGEWEQEFSHSIRNEI